MATEKPLSQASTAEPRAAKAAESAKPSTTSGARTSPEPAAAPQPAGAPRGARREPAPAAKGSGVQAGSRRVLGGAAAEEPTKAEKPAAKAGARQAAATEPPPPDPNAVGAIAGPEGRSVVDGNGILVKVPPGAVLVKTSAGSDVWERADRGARITISKVKGMASGSAPLVERTASARWRAFLGA